MSIENILYLLFLSLFLSLDDLLVIPLFSFSFFSPLNMPLVVSSLPLCQSITGIVVYKHELEAVLGAKGGYGEIWK